jgi:hypothetical protein
MSKKIPKPDPRKPDKEANWLVTVDVTDEQGCPVYGPD